MKRVLLAFAMLVTAVLAATPAHAAPVSASALGAIVTVSPQAEVTVDPLRTDQVAWVDSCLAGRFCTFQVGSGGQYIGFQFYRCTEYALSNFGVNTRYSRVFNNQNVTVQYLDSSHRPIASTPPGGKAIVDFQPVWYINLCA
ncbi:hypothetical protein [Catenuloplanes japonicus]|uniref:hypothetical protein n=1 Tax=Catenuloplanes japonicus TaxID=33876 RepID=UPI000B2A7445|nr:hypothetical protein [Catenuloplanes japonicus]